MPSRLPPYYGRKAWSPSAVITAKNVIASSGLKFDSFAVRGVSGMVFGAKLAHLMRKNLVVVRKPTESSHSNNKLEGLRADRYIFLDDFTSTGKTLGTVERVIHDTWPSAVMVGSYLYEKDDAFTIRQPWGVSQ